MRIENGYFGYGLKCAEEVFAKLWGFDMSLLHPLRYSL